MATTPESARQRLVEIDDEMRALPDDAFEKKYALGREADELRQVLEDELGDELDQASDDWAERAGHKGSHSVSEEERLAQAALPSPLDN